MEPSPPLIGIRVFLLDKPQRSQKGRGEINKSSPESSSFAPVSNHSQLFSLLGNEAQTLDQFHIISFTSHYTHEFLPCEVFYPVSHLHHMVQSPQSLSAQGLHQFLSRFSHALLDFPGGGNSDFACLEVKWMS